MIRGALLLVIDVILLLFLAVLPIVRTGEEDRGDGFSSVVLPMPHKVSRAGRAFSSPMVIASAIFAVAARNTLSNATTAPSSPTSRTQ